MMSIYIKGMEMPTSCRKCDFFINCDSCEGWECYCPLVGLIGYESNASLDKRRDDCPLIPVPKHGDLIDKDALEQDVSDSVVFSGRENNPEIYGANKIINCIHHAPTIIPADKDGGE